MKSKTAMKKKQPTKLLILPFTKSFVMKKDMFGEGHFRRDRVSPCYATFFHSWHTKTLFKFLRHTLAQSAEILHTKSAILKILL